MSSSKKPTAVDVSGRSPWVSTIGWTAPTCDKGHADSCKSTESQIRPGKPRTIIARSRACKQGERGESLISDHLGSTTSEDDRAGIAGKRISPHIFRHTFAIRYLILGNDPFSLQELLGHEDMTTVKNYMHMNDETIQEQKRKYSPGDHLPASVPGPRETRRRGYKPADQPDNKKK